MGLMRGRREEQVGPRFRMREKLLSTAAPVTEAAHGRRYFRLTLW
jgi:hypothetical protein